MGAMGGGMGGMGMGGMGGGPGTGGGGLGAMGLDLAPYKMPIIGSLFQNPDELHQKRQMHNMALAYGAMRPETQAAQENVLRQTSLAYQPYQNLMAMGYGASAATPTEGMFRNPMSERMMQIGNPLGLQGEGATVPGSMEAAMGMGQSLGGGGAFMPGLPGGPGGMGGMGGGGLDALMGGGMGGMPMGGMGMGGGMPMNPSALAGGGGFLNNIMSGGNTPQQQGYGIAPIPPRRQ